MSVCVRGGGVRAVSSVPKSKARNVDQVDLAPLKHEEKVDKNEPL